MHGLLYFDSIFSANIIHTFLLQVTSSEHRFLCKVSSLPKPLKLLQNCFLYRVPIIDFTIESLYGTPGETLKYLQIFYLVIDLSSFAVLRDI